MAKCYPNGHRIPIKYLKSPNDILAPNELPITYPPRTPSHSLFVGTIPSRLHRPILRDNKEEGCDMRNNETRNLLVSAYHKHRNANLVASMFAVAPRIVYRLVVRKRDTGSVKLHTSQRGRSPKLNDGQLRQIDELITSAGASAVYLPPCSPDLNLIETMWSKVKVLLRKWKVRMRCLLAWAVEEAISLVTPSDCNGWFSCCSYCL